MVAGAVSEVERIVVKLMTDAVQYHQEMNRAEQKLKRAGLSLDKLARKVSSVGRVMSRFGRQFSMYVTAPVAGFGLFAIREFAKFDQAMTQSMSIMKDVTRGGALHKEMIKTAKDLAMSGTIGPEELAKSYFYLASAGLSARESIDNLATVQRFAIAGAFDMATATDLLTDAVTAFGKDVSFMTQMSDAFALGNEQANATMQQFSEAMTNDAAVAARNYGMELKTAMAILNAYASSGKKGAVAGSMFGRATRLLTTAFLDNEKAFKRYGIEVVDKRTKEYRNYIDIIADMEKAFKHMKAPARAAALEQMGFAALAQKSILPLIGMSKQMKIWEQEQQGAAGTTKRIMEKQLQSFTNQLKITWNQIKVVGMEIGEVLAPALLKVNKWLREGIKWWRALDPMLKKWITWGAVIAAVVGPLAILTGMFITLVGFMLPALKILAIVTAIAGAIGGLVWYLVGTQGLVDAWKASTKVAGEWWQKVKGFLTNFRENLKIAVDWVKENWRALPGELGRAMMTIIKNLWFDLGVAMRGLAELIALAEGYITGVAVRVFNNIIKAVFGEGGGGATVATNILEWFGGVFDKILELAEPALDELADMVMAALTGRKKNRWAGGSGKPSFQNRARAMALQLAGLFTQGMGEGMAGNQFPWDKALEIFQRRAKELRGLLRGHEWGIEGPKFNTAIDEAAEALKRAAEASQQMSENAKRTAEAAERIVAAFKDIQATEVDTAEFWSKVLGSNMVGGDGGAVGVSPYQQAQAAAQAKRDRSRRRPPPTRPGMWDPRDDVDPIRNEVAMPVFDSPRPTPRKWNRAGGWGGPITDVQVSPIPYNKAGESVLSDDIEALNRLGKLNAEPGVIHQGIAMTEARIHPP